MNIIFFSFSYLCQKLKKIVVGSDTICIAFQIFLKTKIHFNTLRSYVWKLEQSYNITYCYSILESFFSKEIIHHSNNRRTLEMNSHLNMCRSHKENNSLFLLACIKSSYIGNKNIILSQIVSYNLHYSTDRSFSSLHFRIFLQSAFKKLQTWMQIFAEICRNLQPPGGTNLQSVLYI